MTRVSLLLLSLLIAGPLSATGQIPDELRIGNRTHSLNTNPLEPFLAANPGRLPHAPVVSSALWRGYIATWSVRDRRFFLDDVRVPTEDYTTYRAPESKRYRSVMEPLFGGPGPRLASWFTGHLIVPTGVLVDYVHMGYGSTYSSYLILTIVEGTVRRQRQLDAAGFDRFRRAQYARYKETPEYAAARAEVEKGDDPMSAEEIEEFLFQFASAEYTSRIFGVEP